ECRDLQRCRLRLPADLPQQMRRAGTVCRGRVLSARLRRGTAGIGRQRRPGIGEAPMHTGSCHCGAVRYRVEVDLASPLTCNCSYCSRRGSILAFTPVANFELEQGEEALTEYRFNTNRIQHLFCSTCGMESFARGTAPDGSQMV